jgi:hypothetical protein
MFERHHDKKELVAYEAALANWQGERDTHLALIDMAKEYTGEVTSREVDLESGEALFATVTSVSLIEERRSGGQGQSALGLTIPVGSLGGRAVRYRVGASADHQAEGTPAANAIDTGTLHVTDRRVAFTGATHSRQCPFDELRSVQVGSGATTFLVTNGARPTTVHYGAGLDGWFGFRLELALAHHADELGTLLDHLSEQLRELDGRRPKTPTPRVRHAS